MSVKDTGIGISHEDRGRLFQMFHRIGGDPLKPSEGTGIGLAVTKHLVEQMGGAIGLESSVGVGSTFWIDLPSAR